MFYAVALLFQAILPTPAQVGTAPENSRLEFTGPGLVCGAAYSIRLFDDETAELTAPTAVTTQISFQTRLGEFVVRESQYATDGGELVGGNGEGALYRRAIDAGYDWIYRNNAPGSSDFSGPAVNAEHPSEVFERVDFHSPRYRAVNGEPCLSGVEVS